jgi:hypothetical protein
MSDDMKRKFLGSISELIAMHDTAAQVSSAALVEEFGEDHCCGGTSQGIRVSRQENHH